MTVPDMSACVIVSIGGHSDWPENWHGGVSIPDATRPTVMHLDRAAAEKEAMRLATLFPAGRFLIFEAVSVGMSIRVPTHVNLAGTVLIENSHPAVLQIGDIGADDHIPF